MYFCFKITAASSNYTRQLPHEMQQGGSFFYRWLEGSNSVAGFGIWAI
jgi:hypothetical protein